MKKVKWSYAWLIAIVIGAFSFAMVSCSDDDDPKTEKGEVVETPDPVVEYYIMGTVTDGGKGLSNISVKVGTETVKTDANGKFSITEKNKGTYAIEVISAGYLTQKSSVEIDANAVNRSVVSVAIALTKQSETVKVEKGTETNVKDNSTTNAGIPDLGTTTPDKVVEDLPIAKVEVTIPADALPQSGTGINADGSANISVTTYVPAPEAVTTEVKKQDENKEVAKTIPLAAANFEPTGLKFEKPVTISIPNPIPEITFPLSEMQLTYYNPTTGKWEKETGEVSIKGTSYQAPINHFSSYAVENKVVSKVSSETIVKTEVLGQANKDNSENPKAVTGIVLKYKEKNGWECKDADITAAVKGKLAGATDATVNAMVAFFKTRLYSLMGSAQGITETERTYNTVNVNGYTTMSYACYAKTRTTTLTTTVTYKGTNIAISVIAKRYTGTDHQYKTVASNPTHSGGQGGTN